MQYLQDQIREQCRELLLKGQLAQVIAAQQFLGYSDQEFGDFLAPLLKPLQEADADPDTNEKTNAPALEEKPQPVEAKEKVSQPTPTEKPVEKTIQTGTILLNAGYYAIYDENGQKRYTGNIGEYRNRNLEHGQLVQFNTKTGEILQILGFDPKAPELHYIQYGVVEQDPITKELIVQKDIYGNSIKDLGAAFTTFYFRDLAHRFNVHVGDTVDLFIKEDGYTYLNWVHPSYDSTNTITKTRPTTKKAKTERNTRSTIDYDLTGKKVTLYSIPPRMIQEIEQTLLQEKGAASVQTQELGTLIAGFKTSKARMLNDTDLVVIAKTGISHTMSEELVEACKEKQIPFAYANQPSLKRIEMAIYRALNGYPSDEISAGNLQYPAIKTLK